MLYKLGNRLSIFMGQAFTFVLGTFRTNGTDAHLVNGSGDKLIIKHRE